MSRRSGSSAAGTVSRNDIESKLRELQGEVDSVGERARTGVLVAGAVAAVTVLAAVYLLGRRRGKKRTTVVEIRRV